MRCKRAVTGACLFVISGPDNADKAKKLEEKLLGIFHDKEGIKIARPTKMAELRVSELDDSVSQRDIILAVTRDGKCDSKDVKVEEIRAAPNGTGIAWLRCPLTAANKIVGVRRITIG